MRAILPRSGDYHAHTFKYDRDFQLFMDFLLGETWRWWPDENKRVFAKRWNFNRLYGTSNKKLDPSKK